MNAAPEGAESKEMFRSAPDGLVPMPAADVHLLIFRQKISLLPALYTECRTAHRAAGM